MKKYTIYANCQGPSLSRILNSSANFSSQYDYVPIKLVQHIDTNYLSKITEEIIPQVDLFIYQPVSETYKNNFKYSSDYLRDHLKQDCLNISFPSCYFRGYYPELRTLKNQAKVNIPINFNLNNNTTGTSLIHNFNIIKGYLLGGTIDEIKKTFVDDNLFDQGFLEKVVEDSVDALKNREKQSKIDVKISSFVKDNFRQQKLFHTFNHPTENLLEYIAKSILESLSIDPDIVMKSSDLFGNISYPIHQLVYRTLKLKFENVPEHRIKGCAIKLEDVIKQYVELYETIPRNILENNLENWEKMNRELDKKYELSKK